MKEGRRLVMVAEFDGKMAGMGQLIFRFANGYQDAEAANGTDIAVSYAVGGYAKDGFDGAAKAADKVLGEQIERLRKLIET